MTKADDPQRAEPRHITLFGRSYSLPRSRLARIAIGVALIIGGILGFLPVLGFWMVPLGLIVLSQDIPAARRFRRKIWVRINRWWAGRSNLDK